MKAFIRIIAGVLALASAAGSAEQSTESGPVSAGTSCTAPGASARGDALPQVQELGSVRMITGGIGVDEARAMRQAEPDYPLALTFVQRFGDKDRFQSAVLVEIQSTSGEPVLCATSDGPFMFVDLPPGEYRVSATSDGGRMLSRKASVTEGGHRELTFVWPASAGAH